MACGRGGRQKVIRVDGLSIEETRKRIGIGSLADLDASQGNDYQQTRA